MQFGASGERPPREAFVVLHDRVAQTACEAVVAVDEGAVRSWREVLGVQAAITLDEYIECEQAVRADPRFREALARRGITNPELVLAEAWSIGDHAESGRRGGGWPGRLAGSATAWPTTRMPARSKGCSP